MNNKIKIFFITLTLMIASSCQDIETDLEVPSLNDPDYATIASDAASLEAVAGGLFRNWFMTTSNTDGPAAAMKTMADVATCSWGNFGMKDLSSEPRVAFNNSSSYGNDVTYSYFNSLYSILSDSNMLIFAVENETAEFTDADQIKMAGKMGQALSVGYLALVFDRTWIPNEETGEIVEVDHNEAMIYALNRLDEAIALANAGTSLPENSIAGADVSGASVSKILSSIGARMLVNNVRNKSEKNTINWEKVKTYASNGITSDFTIFMDDTTWFDLIPKTYLVYPGWGRVDMRIIHMMDPNTPDYWSNTIETLEESTSPDARLTSDYQYLPSNNFRPARGKYHFSSYRYSRYDDYITNWVMDLVEYTKSENDMYLAEAKLNLGDVPGAALIVNTGTRVTRGNLPLVPETEEAVADAIFYERMVEFAFSTMGISFFEMRKEDLLQPGTLLHFPVPGKASATIPESVYSYGGSSGTSGEDFSAGGWRN